MKNINLNQFNLFKFKRNFVLNRDEFILKFCKGKKILHIGACDSPFTRQKINEKSFLHHHLMKVSNNVHGIDIDTDSIKLLHSIGIKNIYNIDLSNINDKDSKFLYEENFDVIVFGETIEHLLNPGLFLDGLRKIMNKNTILCISTPNSLSIFGFFRGLINKEYIHSDHKLSFTMGSLIQLLMFKQFEINDYYFTFLRKPNFLIRIGSVFFKLFPLFSNNLLILCSKNNE